MIISSSHLYYNFLLCWNTMLIFLGNSAFIYAIWSCVKNVCPFDNPVTFEFCNIHIIFLNGLTKGTLSYLILTTQWIHVNWCQILVILLAILLQCISKDNTASWFLTSVVFIMSPIVSELTVVPLSPPCSYYKQFYF